MNYSHTENSIMIGDKVKINTKTLALIYDGYLTVRFALPSRRDFTLYFEKSADIFKVITIDNQDASVELKSANGLLTWVPMEIIIQQKSEHWLTLEIIKKFKNKRVRNKRGETDYKVTRISETFGIEITSERSGSVFSINSKADCDRYEIIGNQVNEELYGRSTIAATAINITDVNEYVYNNTPNDGEIKMAPKQSIKETGSELIDVNKNAALLASKVAVGKAVNKKLIKALKPKLPIMIRSYADTPLAPLIMANLAAFAIKQYMPDNKKANAIVEVALLSASFQAAEAIDIEGILTEFLNGIEIPGFEESSQDED